MKLSSFSVAGTPTFGVVTDRGLHDLGKHFSGRYRDLKSFIGAGMPLDRSVLTSLPAIDPDSVEFLPVVPNPECIIIAVGWAYKSHQDETNHKADEFPQMFTKHARSLVGHGQPAIKPRASDQFDFEGELAVVIGKSGRAIPASSAMDHLAGYTILMDGSVRDYQKHSPLAGKNFDHTSPYGPWLVTKDEIPNPHALQLTTRLNGQVMQQSGTDLLAWSIPFLISYCSTFTKLEPGDAISTGTPGGVGHKRNPQVFMKAGDVIEVEISGIGVLRNTIAAEYP